MATLIWKKGGAIMKYYVVFSGRQTGVYNNWRDCQEQVHGHKGAVYKSYPCPHQAKEALTDYLSKATEERPMIGICSDAAYSSKTKLLQFRVANIQTLEVVHYNSFKNCENATNIGEFLGLVRAIKYVLDNKMDCPIYSDSATAIAWVQNKQVKSPCLKEADNAKLKPLIDSALAYLQSINLPAIIKWDTRQWGEIPADYGNKPDKGKQSNKVWLYGQEVRVVNYVNKINRYHERDFLKMLCTTNDIPTVGMDIFGIADKLPHAIKGLHRERFGSREYVIYLTYKGVDYEIESKFEKLVTLD